MEKRVFIHPSGDDLSGGVSRHVQALRKHLPSFGWEIVDSPTRDVLIHVNAMSDLPEVDVYTNHGIYPIKEKMSPWQREVNRSIFRHLKLARQAIAVSKWTASQWSGLTGIKPHIIPNGIDPEEFEYLPKESLRAKLGIGHRHLVLWGKTSFSEVLDPTPAFNLALHRPDITVAILVPPEKIAWKPENVLALGLLPREYCLRLIQESDVYLATVQENHSIQVLEAMALGTPILGYDWGGTAETIRNDVDGYLVEPGSIEGLVRGVDEVLEYREYFTGNARLHVFRDFLWKDMIRRTAEVYDQALEEKVYEQDPKSVVCSIVIPVYNKEKFIKDTLESALSQLDVNHEVIVVDDGSKDESLKVIREVESEHPDAPLRVFACENGGVHVARNFGISQAKGRYIMCLDADDLITPSALKALSRPLESDPELGLAYSDFTSFGHTAEGVAFEAPLQTEEYEFPKLVKGNFIPCCNLFRKKAWKAAGGYKNIPYSWEDYELWLTMGELGWPGKHVPGNHFMYRKVPQLGRDFESQGHEWLIRATINTLHRGLYPPAVSIVIPCYKQSRFLETSLRSAVLQSFPDLEVIVVDDGNGPDEALGIRQIVESYDSPDVRLVRLPVNSGLASARNAGIEAARGEWILPLDADDKIDSQFIEKVLKVTRGDPRVFAYSDTYIWRPGEEKELEELPAEDYSFSGLLKRVSWTCMTIFSKKAWTEVGGYDPSMSKAGGWEDWDLMISFGEHGICGVHVPGFLAYYRQYSEQQMRALAEEKKPFLQEALRQRHSATYRGEWPMSCCGRLRQADPKVSLKRVDGRIWIRYVGSALGALSWICPSNRRYQFGLASPLQAVPPEDAEFLLTFPDFRKVE